MNHIPPSNPAPFSFIEEPFPLLRALVARNELLVNGGLYRPAMDGGPAILNDFNLTGYIWPYLQRGQNADEQSHLWFFLKEFRAPSYAHSEFDNIRSNMNKLLSGECYDFDFVTTPVADGISAESLVFTSLPLKAIASGLGDLIAQRFLDIGNIKEPKLMMSTAPCPDPFSWGIPDTSDLELHEV